MPEGGYSCNYTPAQALEVFEYIAWVNVRRSRLMLSRRDLPPSRSPLRRLVAAVLEDLECLGAAKPGKLAFYLPKARWKYLINCKWVCATCPHVKQCPFGALFKVKGWGLPDKAALEKLFEKLYGEEE